MSDPVTISVLLMWFGHMLSRTYSEKFPLSLVLQERWPGTSFYSIVKKKNSEIHPNNPDI